MKFSIVIPTLNAEGVIHRSLKSIADQTFQDYEIIIQDSLSTDKTVSAIEALKQQYPAISIRVFEERDKGVYDAMNKAIKKAGGEWVYFLGSDDYLYDEEVLRRVHDHIAGAGKEPDMVYGNVLLKSTGQPYAGEFGLKRLLTSENICHQSVFYKKELFDRLGAYNLNYKIWADWDFNIRCFQHTGLVISFIDEIIALYNDEYGTSSHQFDEELYPLLPVYYIHQSNREQQSIRAITQSRSYRLGSKVHRLLDKLGLVSLLKKLNRE